LKNFVATLVAWGPPGLLLLAALDSAGVPIPAAVDALLMLLAANSPSTAYIAAACATIGSVAGSMFLFYLARKGGEKYLEKHTVGERGRKLRLWFQHYGLLTVFISAISPIPMPMKLFVVSAGALGVPPQAYFLTVLAARIARYFTLAYLGSQLGDGAGAYLKSHAWNIGGILALLFALLFGCVKVMDYRRARLSPTA
jgi:membrane protein YqaA with SNARE-associated domain